MTSSFGLNNLLERLTELRETFCLPDYWFIIKGYNSETGRWKRCTGQGMGLPCPHQTYHSRHFHMLPKLEGLRNCPLSFYGGFITQS